MKLPVRTTEWVREHLKANREITLVDLREEGVFAEAHPLFAASLPLSTLELEILDRIPRKDVPVVLYDDGEGLVARAATMLGALGYTDVSALDGGLDGWRAAGGEIFRDVNTPSKAFGELVESVRHTPFLSAQEVKALINAQADVVILDARRYDEYQTMNIPGSVSVPGGELVYRVGALAPRATTTVIVNCAGRTRSLIGTQSLVNAGVANRVFALRNGTIGWTLAGQDLEHGANRRASEPPRDPATASRARALADRAGVKRIALNELPTLLYDQARTTYRFDVRTPEEYAAGHLAGFRSAPGGQLVQETDAFAPVRGARVVLSDDTGVRADMTASWLAQMNWEVFVLDDDVAASATETGSWKPRRPPLPQVKTLTPAELDGLLRGGHATLFDLSPSAAFAKAHIPGAWFAIRAQLRDALEAAPRGAIAVLTSADGALTRYAAGDLAEEGLAFQVLDGGNAAWIAAGLAVESGIARAASAPTDRYRRPYEGTDNPVAAMQAYLDWEFGLVEQLGRDGTHGFRVL